MRVKLPQLRPYGALALAILCLIVAYWVPPIVAYVLTMAAFVFIFEGALSLYERNRPAGGMKDFHQ